MVNGRHIRVGFGRDHGEALALPNAPDEHHVLPRISEFVWSLDGLSRPRRGIGLGIARLKESRHRDEATPVLHGVAPGRFHRALNARIEYNATLP